MITTPDLLTLMKNQDFEVEFYATQGKAFEDYLENLEMLLLLNKVKQKKHLGSRIYLALLHRRFSCLVKKVYLPEWEQKMLQLLGYLLGFRI